MRYILVEYKYGFERAHEYSYSQVYTHSIPWLDVMQISVNYCHNSKVQLGLLATLSKYSEPEAQSAHKTKLFASGLDPWVPEKLGRSTRQIKYTNSILSG